MSYVCHAERAVEGRIPGFARTRSPSCHEICRWGDILHPSIEIHPPHMAAFILSMRSWQTSLSTESGGSCLGILSFNSAQFAQCISYEHNRDRKRMRLTRGEALSITQRIVDRSECL